jgi:hypothetical protein
MSLPIEPIPSENKPKDKRLSELPYDLPKLPSNFAVLGRVGTGKTSCVYSLLSKGYVVNGKSVFTEIVCYIGNKESDKAFKDLPCENVKVLHTFNLDAFDKYIENLRKQQLERLEKGKHPLNVCLVFDDMATTDLLKKRKGKSPLASLLLTSRHELNVTVFFLTQIYKSTGFSIPMIRNNVTTWIIYNMSKPEAVKISEDHCQDFEPKEFLAIYERKMATPHNFITIDYRRPLDGRITEQFDLPFSKEA